jgi:hypothetical protein
MSTDLWTDNFRKIPYITIVAHFTSSEWKCERFALLTRAFLNEHTGENIKRDLQSAVDEFNIKINANIPTIVSDQGSNVLLASKLMRWYQINCAAHVFNLVIVADGFKKIPAVMRMMKKCQDRALFLQFKSVQVSVAQEELRLLIENMPPEFTDHCYFEDFDMNTSTSSVKKKTKTKTLLDGTRSASR